MYFHHGLLGRHQVSLASNTSPSTTSDGRFTVASDPVTDVPVTFSYVQPAPGQSPNSTNISMSYVTSSSLGQSVSNTQNWSWGSESGVSVSFLDDFKTDISNQQTMSATYGYNTGIQGSSTAAASAYIQGPPCSGNPCNPQYTGPTQFNVFQDNLYGTFMFWPAN